jgi:hypothetical protein
MPRSPFHSAGCHGGRVAGAAVRHCGLARDGASEPLATPLAQRLLAPAAAAATGICQGLCKRRPACTDTRRLALSALVLARRRRQRRPTTACERDGQLRTRVRESVSIFDAVLFGLRFTYVVTVVLEDGNCPNRGVQLSADPEGSLSRFVLGQAHAEQGLVELASSGELLIRPGNTTAPLALMLQHGDTAEPCSQGSNATILLGPAQTSQGSANAFAFSIVATSGHTVRLSPAHCAKPVAAVCLAVVGKQLGLGPCHGAQSAFTRSDV